MPEEKLIGKVTHYYTNLGVGIIELKDELTLGEILHFKGHTTDFTQKVASMQAEHENVEKAGAGTSIGLKVDEHVRVGDEVYKVTE